MILSPASINDAHNGKLDASRLTHSDAILGSRTPDLDARNNRSLTHYAKARIPHANLTLITQATATTIASSLPKLRVLAALLDYYLGRNVMTGAAYFTSDVAHSDGMNKVQYGKAA